jgi:hypothetical protein
MAAVGCRVPRQAYELFHAERVLGVAAGRSRASALRRDWCICEESDYADKFLMGTQYGKKVQDRLLAEPHCSLCRA